MKKVNLIIFCISLILSVQASYASTQIECTDSVYLGKTKFIANLEKNTFRISQEVLVNLPKIEYEIVAEGTISDIVTVGAGLATILELESDTNETGEIRISNKSLSSGLPSSMKLATLVLNDRNYGVLLICNL